MDKQLTDSAKAFSAEEARSTEAFPSTQIAEASTPQSEAAPQTEAAPQRAEAIRPTQSRHDPISDRWTLFAPNRDDRPQDFEHNVEKTRQISDCAFCEGHEDQTPPPRWIGRIREQAASDGSLIEIDRDPGAATTNQDWSVRVVPNKYPAVNDYGQNDYGQNDYGPGPKVADTIEPESNSESSLLRRQWTQGGHEVIIESPDHVRSLSQLNPLHTELMLRAFQDRLKHYQSCGSVRYVSIFKNVGRDAGASLSHSHSQLLAMTQTPGHIAHSFSMMKRHRANTGCCLMCDLIREERQEKRRIVARDDRVITFCPFSSPLPMMARITTTHHHRSFENLGGEDLRSVARMLFRMIGWIEKECPGCSYNFFLNVEPLGTNDPSDSFHWSIDLFPRLTCVAGFEWSSGCMINPVLPEVAAKRYRRWAEAENPRSFA